MKGGTKYAVNLHQILEFPFFIGAVTSIPSYIHGLATALTFFFSF